MRKFICGDTRRPAAITSIDRMDDLLHRATTVKSADMLVFCPKQI
jgi:hypothetical protein